MIANFLGSDEFDVDRILSHRFDSDDDLIGEVSEC